MPVQLDVAAEPRAQAPPAARARSSYLPTLDGWRAVAILLVLLGHSPTIGHGPVSTFRFHVLADFGVRIFFAISGLLICTRLLDEEDRTGSLHLRGFYVRRLLRIQPPALVYLAAVAVLILLGRFGPAWTDLLAAVFLFRNYMPFHPAGYPTAHFWSLAVEEHFYLFLPVFLLSIKRHRAWILLCLALLVLAWANLDLWQMHWAWFPTMFRTDTAVYALLLAAACALLLRRPRFRTLCGRYLRGWWLVPITALATSPRMHLLLFLELAPSLLVIATLLRPRSWLGRLLEWPPLRFVGRISFSLYLWQMIFLTGFYAPELHPFGDMQRLWVVWPCTFAAALLSFCLVERPSMRLGHRLAPPATEGRIV